MGKLHDLVKLRNTLVDKMYSLSLAPDIQGKIQILNSIFLGDGLITFDEFKILIKEKVR